MFSVRKILKNRLLRRRLWRLGLIFFSLSTATFLVLLAFQENLMFFYTPHDVGRLNLVGQRFRLGGFVATDSVKRGRDNVTVRFVVTYEDHSVPVIFTGLLPDLFREGQGIIAEGRLRQDGVFEAETVLAKHDENYTPPSMTQDIYKPQVP